MTERTSQPDPRHVQMIERAVQRCGLSIREWRFNSEDRRDEAPLGRFRAIEDDEDVGVYSGDEGELTAMVVGAQEFGNERVTFTLYAEGIEGGNEVSDLDLLEELDE